MLCKPLSSIPSCTLHYHVLHTSLKHSFIATFFRTFYLVQHCSSSEFLYRVLYSTECTIPRMYRIQNSHVQVHDLKDTSKVTVFKQQHMIIKHYQVQVEQFFKFHNVYLHVLKTLKQTQMYNNCDHSLVHRLRALTNICD